MAQPSELPESENRAVTAAIREQLARKRMSRQRLADAAKISISTLEKALGGSRPFTLATLVRLEAALGIALRPAAAEESLAAPGELGGYARDGVRWLEGDYLTLRPSFEAAETIFAYSTKIAWDAARQCLAFSEADRLDAPFAQRGVVSVPNKSGHVYLYTNDAGQMRLAILGRPGHDGAMYGVLTTLQMGRGTQLLPVAVPLALLPRTADTIFGRIGRGAARYGAYRARLDSVAAQGFARLITG